MTSSCLGSFIPLCAAFSDFCKGCRSIYKLAAIGLLASHRDLVAEFRETQSFDLFPFLEETQAFPQDLALSLVVAALQKTGDKFIKS